MENSTTVSTRGLADALGVSDERLAELAVRRGDIEAVNIGAGFYRVDRRFAERTVKTWRESVPRNAVVHVEGTAEDLPPF